MQEVFRRVSYILEILQDNATNIPQMQRLMGNTVHWNVLPGM